MTLSTTGGRPKEAEAGGGPSSGPSGASAGPSDLAPGRAAGLAVASAAPPHRPGPAVLRGLSCPGETFEAVAKPSRLDRFFHMFPTWMAGFLCPASLYM